MLSPASTVRRRGARLAPPRMPDLSSQPSPPGAAGVRAVVETVDAALGPIHAARLAELGPDGSGLFDHYAALLEAGSLFRSGDLDRLAWVLNRMPAYDRYVVYRAGLGEMALALALAGRRVVAWEAHPARRAALEAGQAALSGAVRAAGGELVVAGRDPESIPSDPSETSLGLAFDLLASFRGADDAEAVRRLFGVNALLYEPRLFLRARDPDAADGEARALLAVAGFDAFRPGPFAGLMLATRGPLQPPRLRVAPTAEPGPRPRRASDGPARGLIAIVGSSYCGSTLLNALLGAHPQVAGGGELHWLTTEFERGRCAICGDDCPVWTRERRAAVTHQNLYDMTAAAFGRPFVADASKKADWFRALQHLTPGLPVTNLLIAKHPVRHVSSYVHKARFKPNFNGDPDYVLRTLRELYQRTEAQLPPDLAVRYEDLATDPRGVVTAILQTRGLDWDDRIDDWQAQPHHHIGGNMGPRAQIARSTRIADESLTRKYARDGVFLDDSYLDILDEATFERITRNPDAIAICAMFGYEELPFPAPARA